MAHGNTVDGNRLDSWKAIAAYLGKDVRTAIRWETSKNLPVHRVRGGSRRAVFAYTHEIDAWLKHDAAMARGDLASPPEAAYVKGPIPDQSSDIGIPSDAHLPIPTRRGFAGGSLLVAMVGLTFISVTLALLIPRSHHNIVVTHEEQITQDRQGKIGLVTDGKWLYFGEIQDGRITLAQVSVNGGPIRRLTTRFVQAKPEDISRDAKRLLVLAWDSTPQEDKELWIVPVDGSAPQRVGNIMCHSANWSPDGRSIAFAQGRSIYLTTDSGSSAQPIRSFDGVPVVLRWSLDGKRIRFQIQDSRNEFASHWELSFGGAGNTGAVSLAHLKFPFEDPASETKLISDNDDSFVAHAYNGDGTVSYLNRNPFSEVPTLRQIAVSKKIGSLGELTIDPHEQRLFMIAGHAQFSEMVRYNNATKEFRPFLPGVGAEYVDFSKDGKSIVYVTDSDRALWVSNADGTQAHAIVTPALTDLELPRWSPDGRFIAFMAKQPNRPYRIYVASVRDGEIREAAVGTDDQGAPTWSPDGKWLVYGNVKCLQTQTCAIHQIELATRHESMIPGSEGLATARWSPDGRYVVALKPEQNEVQLLDLKSHQWCKIADGVTGNDLAWSADSQAVYASSPLGEKPAILMISIKDGTTRTAVDLSDLTKLRGEVNTFFAIAPNNSIILVRVMRGDDIYSLDYRN